MREGCDLHILLMREFNPAVSGAEESFINSRPVVTLPSTIAHREADALTPKRMISPSLRMESAILLAETGERVNILDADTRVMLYIYCAIIPQGNQTPMSKHCLYPRSHSQGTKTLTPHSSK